MKQGNVITKSKMIEKVIQINNIKDLDTTLISYDRIYVGCDFCENFLPNKKELVTIFKSLIDRGILFSLLTPTISQKGLVRIENILNALAEINPNTEVVFNDWGVFNLIRKLKLKPIIGRLLIKNKRDPRIGVYYSELLNHTKRFFSELPLSQTFLNYLIKNNIKRVEIDSMTFPLSIKTIKRVDQYIPLSFYYKMGIIAHSQECWLNVNIPGKCHRNCANLPVRLRNTESNFDVILVGNTLFSDANNENTLKTSKILKSLKHKPRLVYTNYPYIKSDI